MAVILLKVVLCPLPVSTPLFRDLGGEETPGYETEVENPVRWGETRSGKAK